MIRLADTLLLASTKLKVRKVRLTITLIIGSLLFAGLFFLAFLTKGVVNSLESFGREGFGGRYLVEGYTSSYEPFMLSGDKALMEQMNAKQKELIAQKKAAAKKLNITYGDVEAANDMTLPLSSTQPGVANAPVILNQSSPIVQAIVNERNRHPNLSFEHFTQVAKAAGAINTYQGARSSIGGGTYGGQSTGPSPSIQVMIDGKEELTQSNPNSFNPSQMPSGIKSITQLGWSQKDTALLQPFILDGQTTDLGADGSVPLIAPVSAAEEILGLKPLPKTATNQEKLDRLAQLRTQIAGKTAQICYRNGQSMELLQKATDQQKEIAANKTNKDYVKPTLEYQLPTTPCGPTTIKRDARPADEKKAEANKLAFDQQFNPVPAAEQGILTVRIVGLNSDMMGGANISFIGILNSLLLSSLGGGWFSPAGAVAKSPLATTILGTYETSNPMQRNYYAEFKTPEEMTAFIDNAKCSHQQDFNSFTAPPSPEQLYEAHNKCVESGKTFSVGPYGNSAAAIKQFRDGIAKVVRYVILVIMVIASIVLMGTIGKIIADSRRETAVFRALGAKRLDIAQIYLTYALLLGALISVLSFIMGFLIVNWFNERYGPTMSVYAVLSYNSSDINKQFSFIGIEPFYLWVIAMLILAAAVISALIPILTNIRRNPIRDMRDDS